MQESSEAERISRLTGSLANSVPNSDDDLSNELRQKDTEIRQLKGKIKGYETLGELYKDMRQKSNVYKAAYEEAVKKLSDLYKFTREGAVGAQEREVEHFLVELNDFLDNPQRSLLCSLNNLDQLGARARVESKDENPSLSLSHKPVTTCGDDEAHQLGLMQGASQHNTGEWGINMSEVKGQHAPQSASRSGSYVDVQGPGSGKSPSFTVVSPSSSNKFPLHSPGVDKQFSLGDARMKVDLSEQLQKLCDICQSIMHERSEDLRLPADLEETSLTTVVQELMRLTMEVLKKEREERIKKVFVDNVVEELDKLRTEVTAKDIRIKQLTNEVRGLCEGVGGIRGSQRDTPPSSSEWEHVQKHQSEETSYDQIRQEITRKEKHIEELEKANHMWEKHNDEVKQRYSHQVEQLEQDLLACRLEAEEAEQTFKQTEAVLREELAAAKEQLQEAEMRALQSQEHLSVLHQQVVSPAPAEQGSSRLEREVAELQRKVAELGAFQQGGMAHMAHGYHMAYQPTQDMSGEETEVSLNSAPMPHGERNLITEIQVLRQQVTIYKDDFERERKAHEKVLGTLKSTRSEVRALNSQMSQSHSQIEVTKRELKFVKEEKLALHSALQKKTEQVNSLRATVNSLRQLQPVYMPVSPSWPQLSVEQSSVYPASPSNTPAVPQQAPARRRSPSPPGSWNCLSCTYSNIPQRVTCEVCGARAPHYPTPLSQANISSNLVHRGVEARGYDVCDTDKQPLSPTSGDDLTIDKLSPSD